LCGILIGCFIDVLAECREGIMYRIRSSYLDRGEKKRRKEIKSEKKSEK
jgi:hypothetical protein